MKTTPEDAFQALLEGPIRQAPDGTPSRQVPAGLATLGLLALALEPASRAEPDARFRRRLRSELMAQASVSEEDVFAAAMDAPAMAHDLVGAAAGIGALVALASALEPADHLVAPETRFRYGLRARLVEMATARPPLRERITGAVAMRGARMRRSLRIVTATGVAAMTLLISGATMVAAQDSLPGDTIYSAKLTQESISLWTVSGSNEGLRKLNFSRRRLGEVRGLTVRGDDRRPLYTDTLNRMDALTIDATDLILTDAAGGRAAVERLSHFAVAQASDLSALLERLPPEIRPAARDSLGVIETAGARADAVLEGCGSCPTDVPADPNTSAQPPLDGSTSAPSSGPCQACGGTGESSDPEVSSGDSGTDDGGTTTTDDPSPPPPPPPAPVDEKAVDLPPVDSTDADEAAEEAVDDLVDTLGVDPPGVVTPTPTLPVIGTRLL